MSVQLVIKNDPSQQQLEEHDKQNCIKKFIVTGLTQ